MIKVMRARMCKNNQITQHELNTEYSDVYLKNGCLIDNEQFLMYKTINGDIMTTLPINHPTHIVDRVNQSELLRMDSLSVDENINFNTVEIIEVIYVKNKRELRKLIKDFNYEKGIG